MRASPAASLWKGLGVLVAVGLSSSFSKVLAYHHRHDPIDCLVLSPNFAEDRTVFLASEGSINLFLVSRNGGRSWTETRSGLLVSHFDAVEWNSSNMGYVAMRGKGLQKTSDSPATSACQ